MKDDNKIWDQYVKEVKKLPRQKRTSPKSLAQKQIVKAPLGIAKTKLNLDPKELALKMTDGVLAAPPFPKAPVEQFNFSPKLDRSRERQLRSGDIVLDATIDLHGLTQSEAYRVLQEFLMVQIQSNHRHLLVITGKGAGNLGVLRQQLPAWLQRMPEGRHILRVCPAAPRHGGAGATYIVLKNTRKMKSV